MKKIYYFRAFNRKKNFIFEKCEGYLVTFYNELGSVDLVVGKNNFNRWTVTELSSGILAHNSTFNTRKEAIEAINAEHLKKIIDQMRAPFVTAAQERLNKYINTLEN